MTFLQVKHFKTDAPNQWSISISDWTSQVKASRVESSPGQIERVDKHCSQVKDAADSWVGRSGGMNIKCVGNSSQQPADT